MVGVIPVPCLNAPQEAPKLDLIQPELLYQPCQADQMVGQRGQGQGPSSIRESEDAVLPLPVRALHTPIVHVELL